MEALQRLHNRGSVSTGFDIDNSLKLEPDNSEYLHKTPTSSGNRRTFTISMWIKRTEIGMDCYLMQAGDGDYNQSDRTLIKFDSTDNFRFGGGSAYQRTTNRVFRDTSAWYHIVMAVDTTDSTAGNRLKLYVNGVQETSFSTSADPSQNFDYAFCKDDKHSVGFNHTDNGAYFAGYMSEVILIDGQQLDPTSFGEFDQDTGIWKPKNVSELTFGTNGFYLDFKDASNLGNDANGGTDFTLVNITAADQATDTPTNNFCTWLPLWAFPKVAGIEEGGTKTNAAFNASTWRGAKGSIGVSKGKWYWENKASGNDTIHGWQTENCVPPSGTNSHNVISTIAFYEGGNYIWLKDSTSGRNDSSVTGTYAGGQVCGFALNLDSSPQTATFYRNGSAIATDVNIDGLANQTIFPLTSHYNQTSQANFGGYTSMSNAHTNTDDNGYGAFVYAPPSGYYALCTKNLEEFG